MMITIIIYFLILFVIFFLLIKPGRVKKSKKANAYSASVGNINNGILITIALMIGMAIFYFISSSACILFIIITGPALFLYSLKSEKKQKSERDFNNFYKDCTAQGIHSVSDLKSEAKKQRALLIAKSNNLSVNSDEDLINYIKRFDKLRDKESSTRLEVLSNDEQKEYDELTLYASLHGIDKPLAMIDDLIKGFTAEANGTSYMQKKRSSDGALLAGMASGIGGSIPALMSLSETAKRNEAISQYNNIAGEINRVRARYALDCQCKADEYRAIRKKFEIMLTKELPVEEIFNYLQFKNTAVKVSETGTITVDVEVSLKKYISIFDNVNAVADGSVIAEIYNKGKKIGDAVLVFDLYGCQPENINIPVNRPLSDGKFVDHFPHGAHLRGMCLFVGILGTTADDYTVKFIPGDLWAIEKPLSGVNY